MRMLCTLRYTMALMTRLQKSSQEDTIDITKNLISLQFESALTKEELQLLHLRVRSHCLSINQCAQATYLIAVLREIRQIRNQLKNPSIKRAQRILQDEQSKDPLIIGIVGCGRLGSQIAQCLLTYGKVGSSEIHISTRRPETLDNLHQKGVNCYYDNIKLVSSVHIIFFCVLPSQLIVVAEEVKGHIPSASLVYVPTNGIPLRRLKQMLGTANLLQPEFSWSKENQEKPWNYNTSVTVALENKEVVEKTCPIYDNVSDCIVRVNPKLAEVIMFAVVNVCSGLGLMRKETLRALHLTIFGENESTPLKDRITLADFGGSESKLEESFPCFDLVQIYENETYITQKLKNSAELRQAFAKKYWQVFEEYLHMRAYGQL